MSVSSTISTTTIKVPVELRDRLAVIARAQGTSLAGAIAHSLEVSEESSFWQQLDAAWADNPPVTGSVTPVTLWKDVLASESVWEDLYGDK